MTSILFATVLVAANTADGSVAAPPPPPPPTVEAAKPGPSKVKDHFMTYASFGFNAFTYLGPTATAPSTELTPASRGIIYQQVGAGYYFHKYLRVQLTFIFGETV